VRDRIPHKGPLFQEPFLSLLTSSRASFSQITQFQPLRAVPHRGLPQNRIKSSWIVDRLANQDSHQGHTLSIGATQIFSQIPNVRPSEVTFFFRVVSYTFFLGLFDLRTNHQRPSDSYISGITQQSPQRFPICTALTYLQRSRILRLNSLSHKDKISNRSLLDITPSITFDRPLLSVTVLLIVGL
jgi:hypothetical protein